MLEKLKRLPRLFGSGRATTEAVLLDEPTGSEVDALLARGQRVEAVRLVRERTGIGLVAANNAVKHREQGH